jgi:hypothetical protein
MILTFFIFLLRIHKLINIFSVNSGRSLEEVGLRVKLVAKVTEDGNPTCEFVPLG